MLGLPLWASALITLLVKGVTQWLANLRAEQDMRNLGAATQQADSLRKAELQEASARKAGAAAADAPDDPRDLRD